MSKMLVTLSPPPPPICLSFPKPTKEKRGELQLPSRRADEVSTPFFFPSPPPPPFPPRLRIARVSDEGRVMNGDLNSEPLFFFFFPLLQLSNRTEQASPLPPFFSRVAKKGRWRDRARCRGLLPPPFSNTLYLSPDNASLFLLSPFPPYQVVRRKLGEWKEGTNPFSYPSDPCYFFLLFPPFSPPFYVTIVVEM